MASRSTAGQLGFDFGPAPIVGPPADPLPARLVMEGLLPNHDVEDVGRGLMVPAGLALDEPWSLPSRLFRHPIAFIGGDRRPDGRRAILVRHPLLVDHPFVRHVAGRLRQVPGWEPTDALGREFGALPRRWHACDLMTAAHWRDLLATRRFTDDGAIAAAVAQALLRGGRPLPRYVRRKALASGAWAHFFEVPTWARRAGCKIANEALGTDYAVAVARAEDVLLPALDSWRTQGASDLAPKRDDVGTLDWAFKLYRESSKFSKLSRSMRRTHEFGFGMVGGYALMDGRRVGAQPLAKITTALVDKLHERLAVVVEADGTRRERTTTVNHAMKSCRRAWNVAFRAHPDLVPALNPFSKMGLVDVSKPTPTATFDGPQAFVAVCDMAGRASIGTAALVAWEWLQREEDVFGSFSAEHYRPKDHPDAVRVVHAKTRAKAWFPLFDEAHDASGRLVGRKQLYPVLQARLDAVKAARIGGLMLVRDWVDRDAMRPLPWPTGKGDLSFLRHEVKDLIRAAGLRDELTFQSFRHGGMTEGGDAELTDRELLAQSRHTTAKVLPLYTKETMRQVASGARKRFASRVRAVDKSE